MDVEIDIDIDPVEEEPMPGKSRLGGPAATLSERLYRIGLEPGTVTAVSTETQSVSPHTCLSPSAYSPLCRDGARPVHCVLVRTALRRLSDCGCAIDCRRSLANRRS